MAIPAEYTSNLLAAHGLVTRNDVLDVARQQVAIVWQAVGEGRAVVKDVFFRAVSLLDGLRESVILSPIIQDFLLHHRERRGALGHVLAGIRAASWGVHGG